MDYREFIEQLRRGFGSAAGRATQVNFYHMWCHKAADAIESLLTENGRLNHNLTSTEQTMREYQELAATRLEEIAKYRDAPVVAYQHRDGMLSCRLPGGGVPGIDWALLIVKPGE